LWGYASLLGLLVMAGSIERSGGSNRAGITHDGEDDSVRGVCGTTISEQGW